MADYLRTGAQIAWNFPTNAAPENVLPDHTIVSLTEITPLWLIAQKIRGLILDVDNCLMGYHGQALDDSVREAFENLERFQKVILSNSNDERFRELGQIFPDIPVLRMYEGPSSSCLYRKLHEGKDYWGNSPNQFGIGAPLRTDKEKIKYEILKGKRNVKKPDARLIEYAMAIMGIRTPCEVAMIGDRVLTDISGGNQAGCYTIQVYPPLQHPNHPEPFGTRVIGRGVDKLVQWRGRRVIPAQDLK